MNTNQEGTRDHQLEKTYTDSIRVEVKQDMATAYKSLEDKISNVDEVWWYFKYSPLDSLKRSCRTYKIEGTRKKRTRWWNEEIREAMQEKKRSYKK